MSSNKRQGSHEDEGTGKKPRQENDEFDYDSGDELPEESIKDRLSWRTDDPFADWKIVIIVNLTTKAQSDKNQDKSAVKKYAINVRKSILADGPRRSEYFVRLFENDGNFSEAQDKTSRIELNKLQAKAFPDLLDYMYSAGHKMMFKTKTATGLYSIAKYFGVRRLENEVKKFCLQDMQHVDTCGTYYEHAAFLQVESILEAAAKFCRDNIKDISCSTSRLRHVADPQFWLDLMKEHAERGTISNIGSRLSEHMARFCRKHAKILSPDIFMQLTDEKYLLANYIKPKAAVLLLEVERRIVGSNGGQQQGTELSSLQTRCVKSFARWKGRLDFNKPWVRDCLTKLPPSVLYEIIAARG